MFKLDDGRTFDLYNLSKQKDVFMVGSQNEDFLVCDVDLGFIGEKVSSEGKSYILAPLVHENAIILRSLYPFTAPSRVLAKDKTMGVGDRLGVATDGHLAVFKAYPEVSPILAQQSIRELNLTNRTFNDIIDCASFAVFRNGYTHPWGADGDHVKTSSEVQYAIESGCTMITLDCSEHIDNTINGLSKAEVDSKYVANKELEDLYLNKSFDIGENLVISFDEESFKRTVLIYSAAIKHAIEIFNTKIMKDNVQLADFEVSIDETLTATTPSEHFFVANELVRKNINICTVAPRFCGEFQKGIDYIGDLSQFEREMKIHAAIARHFNYKISIHSGSDKFSIFPIAGRETQGRFHLKTAGTNWLEAMKLVSIKDPLLYREIHQFALKAFDQARAYYHVTTDLNKIPSLESVEDKDLVKLFDNNDSRQLIHITYGLILNEKNSDGSFKFKDRLYKLWREYRSSYEDLLYSHIGHHLKDILLK